MHVGVTDVGAGAKTTMGLIAAEALGVPLSQVDVVWGDTDRCPYSVGESGSRTTIMTGYAVIEAARDLKKQIAEKGMPTGRRRADRHRRRRTRRSQGKVRNAFGAHFVEVEVDTELGRVRVTEVPRGARLRPHHQSAHGAQPDQGRRDRWASAWRCTRICSTTAAAAAARRPATTARAIATHRDAPEIEVMFIESDDGYGPFGAKSMGESGKVPAPAAVANAIFNAIGRPHEGPADHARQDVLGGACA